MNWLWDPLAALLEQVSVLPLLLAPYICMHVLNEATFCPSLPYVVHNSLGSV